MTGESLAGEVGVAAGRAGFLHELNGQPGRRFSVSIGFSFCGRNHFRGDRRQISGDGIHLLGGLGGRYIEYLLNQFQSVTRAALVTEPRPAPLFVIEAEAVRAAAHRAGLMAVFNHLHTQRREDTRPVAARLFYGFRYVHFHGYFLPQCNTGDVI